MKNIRTMMFNNYYFVYRFSFLLLSVIEGTAK